MTDTAKQIGQVLADGTTLGTPALIACILLFEDDPSEWEPEIIVDGVRRLTGHEMHNLVFQRLMAVCTLLNSDSFFNRPEVFHTVCNTLLTPETAVPDMAEPPTALEMCWACTEAKMLFGSEYRVSAFDDMVKAYAGAALRLDGYTNPPATLSFAVIPDAHFPDAGIISDELSAGAFWDIQKTLHSELGNLLDGALNIYWKQILDLEPLGGSKAVFETIRANTQSSPEQEKAPEETSGGDVLSF